MNETKFISYYQYDWDAPVIIVFDDFKQARKEAIKDIIEASPNEADRKEYLKAFRKNDSVSIGEIVIYAAQCPYQPSKTRRHTS